MRHPSGWYPDPSGPPGQLKYWDGEQWTSHTAAPRAASSQGPGSAGPGGPVLPPPAATEPTASGASGSSTRAAVVVAATTSLCCCGIASFVPPLWGAILEREHAGRRRWWAALSALLGALTILAVGLVGSAPDDSGGTPTGVRADLGGALLLGLWLSGIGVTAYLVFKGRSQPETKMLPGMAVEIERRRQRDAYRDMAVADPAMAFNMAVGRPDLPRQYQDGGLVDLNHIPTAQIARWLPVSEAEALRLAEARETLGRFEGLDDAAVYGELEPATVLRLKEFVIFL
jgi:Protein of unknown function (DUF2510)